MLAIRARLDYLAERNARCCIGGPIDGRRHSKCPGDNYLHHEAHGWWAVYVVMKDWTAKFLGYVGSEKEARLLAKCFWRRYLTEAGRE